MKEKVDYEHKVAGSEASEQLAEAAARRIDLLTTNINSEIESMFNAIGGAPMEDLKEFQDIIDDAASNLFGSLCNQYNLDM